MYIYIIKLTICQVFAKFMPFFYAFLKTAFIEKFFGLCYCVRVRNYFHKIKIYIKNFPREKLAENFSLRFLKIYKRLNLKNFSFFI